ncbi:hypothetical protein [Streptomyces sp. NPDC001933]|uniref:hypothetical protein n=1 Tax=Streptomyces sp. NPDC001933 TaxID=3364626 RepID=UPI0036C200EC
MSEPAVDAYAADFRRIEADMLHGLTLPVTEYAAFTHDYQTTISGFANNYTDPDAAYEVLSRHADTAHEHLVEQLAADEQAAPTFLVVAAR